MITGTRIEAFSSKDGLLWIQMDWVQMSSIGTPGCSHPELWPTLEHIRGPGRSCSQEHRSYFPKHKCQTERSKVPEDVQELRGCGTEGCG